MIATIAITFVVMGLAAVTLCVAAARGNIDGGELDDPVEEIRPGIGMEDDDG